MASCLLDCEKIRTGGKNKSEEREHLGEGDLLIDANRNFPKCTFTQLSEGGGVKGEASKRPTHFF
jgi:hypothetical protein